MVGVRNYFPNLLAGNRIQAENLPFTLRYPFFCQTQDLTGVWQGHFRSNNMDIRSLSYDDRYKFEVQIAQNTKKLEAVTYSRTLFPFLRRCWPQLAAQFNIWYRKGALTGSGAKLEVRK